MQARRGSKLVHILFHLFILAHESKSCRPPPSAQLTANNGYHTVKATVEEGGGGCAETDAAPGVGENKTTLQFWRFSPELKKSKRQCWGG